MGNWNGCYCGEWDKQGECVKCGEHFTDQWDKLQSRLEALKPFIEAWEAKARDVRVMAVNPPIGIKRINGRSAKWRGECYVDARRLERCANELREALTQQGEGDERPIL